MAEFNQATKKTKMYEEERKKERKKERSAEEAKHFHKEK